MRGGRKKSKVKGKGGDGGPRKFFEKKIGKLLDRAEDAQSYCAKGCGGLQTSGQKGGGAAITVRRNRSLE